MSDLSDQDIDMPAANISHGEPLMFEMELLDDKEGNATPLTHPMDFDLGKGFVNNLPGYRFCTHFFECSK